MVKDRQVDPLLENPRRGGGGAGLEGQEPPLFEKYSK